MEDRKHWDLSRNYKDFYALQLALKDSFPAAAGVVPGVKRTLPLMPGPVPWVSEHITQERRSHLDKYLIDLINCSPEITTSWPVKQFFSPRHDDVPIHDRPDSSDTDYRHSGTSSQNSAPLDSQSSSAGNISTSTTSTSYNTSPSRQNQQSPYNNHAAVYPHSKPPPTHYRQPSGFRHPSGTGNQSSSSTLAAPPPMLRNNSAMTSASALSNQSQASTAPVKVKVWFGNTSCIIIRLPPTFGYQDLLVKLQERWESNEAANNDVTPQSLFEVEWRDEDKGDHHPLDGDGDLQTAREHCEKLTLRVRPA